MVLPASTYFITTQLFVDPKRSFCAQPGSSNHVGVVGDGYLAAYSRDKALEKHWLDNYPSRAAAAVVTFRPSSSYDSIFSAVNRPGFRLLNCSRP
jgi:hypothetical protein